MGVIGFIGKYIIDNLFVCGFYVCVLMCIVCVYVNDNFIWVCGLLEDIYLFSELVVGVSVVVYCVG